MNDSGSKDDEPSEEDRSLLDQLLVESKLYRTSREFQELIKFIVRLRNMAPFNAMLLQIQKPGLSYAASRFDWQDRFNRTVKERARPLLIMWPFGPVALVYDVLDTEGDDLPKDAFSFYAAGDIDQRRIGTFAGILERKNVLIDFFDEGGRNAGVIRRVSIPEDDKEYSEYRVGINRNYTPAMAFATLVHELAHLFLGHLGNDRKLKISARKREHRICEIEAEAVSSIVCERNGVEIHSTGYLHGFIKNEESADDLDLYAITRTAGQIERLLMLSKSATPGERPRWDWEKIR